MVVIMAHLPSIVQLALVVIMAHLPSIVQLALLSDGPPMGGKSARTYHGCELDPDGFDTVSLTQNSSRHKQAEMVGGNDKTRRAKIAPPFASQTSLDAYRYRRLLFQKASELS